MCFGRCAQHALCALTTTVIHNPTTPQLQRFVDDESAQLLDPQGTTKKRGGGSGNGKGRTSEDGESLLVVVPNEESNLIKDTPRRSLEGVSPTDSMDESLAATGK